MFSILLQKKQAHYFKHRHPAIISKLHHINRKHWFIAVLKLWVNDLNSGLSCLRETSAKIHSFCPNLSTRQTCSQTCSLLSFKVRLWAKVFRPPFVKIYSWHSLSKRGQGRLSSHKNWLDWFIHFHWLHSTWFHWLHSTWFKGVCCRFDAFVSVSKTSKKGRTSWAARLCWQSFH